MIGGGLVALVPLALSVVVLWIGAEVFVSRAARVARRFGLSELVVGLTVVAMGTSAPEVAVSVDAALVGNGDIAVANVVGSNLFNIGIILGGIAVIVGVRSSARMVRRDGTAMVLSTLLLLAVLWDLRVSRLEGVVLLVAFVGYLTILFVQPDERVEDPIHERVEDPMDEREATWRTALFLVGGLGTIVVGAHFLVESAVVVAASAGLSEWIIGETIVAVGTSTPEIVASVAAARKGLGDIAAGNLIGSNVFNALFVLGVTSTLTPIEIAATAIGTTIWLLGLSVLTALLLGTNRKLGHFEGAALTAINLSRWILDVV
ncbi:Na+/Ca+ antiporter, CaCA family protein [Halostagnicola sp. A56]|uniref:calcium/sodium antiporter n=1 Tax=Halostagnicola sp. A56 TaxID=1495067 RepID=UPI00049FE007|nr:calcium/sodium antiporter [Halostagnicola sp. A56]KDE60138.1 Na+/Ca+ antiporter, CaCA family protein [Halostagnicola sp. A56]